MPDLGIQTETLTAGVAVLQKTIAPFTVNVLLRCPATNTHKVYCSFGQLTATTADIVISAGETISIDISDDLHLKASMGFGIQNNDFIPNMSYLGGAAAQTLYIDTFTLNIPKTGLTQW